MWIIGAGTMMVSSGAERETAEADVRRLEPSDEGGGEGGRVAGGRTVVSSVEDEGNDAGAL